MNLLAIETSSDACSCALALDGSVQSRHVVEPRRHTELVLPMIDSLLAEAGIGLSSLDVIAFGRGPGSFTGLRIACGVAQGLAFGAERPVVAVSSLQILATGARRAHGVDRALVALDARMGEVYWGGYAWDGEVMAQVLDEAVCAPGDAVMPDDDQWWGIGPGWASYRDVLTTCGGARIERLEPDCLPHAIDMIDAAERAYRIGAAIAPEHAAPIYLRSRVAHAAPRRIER